jgi:hypothetical protein
VDAGCQQFLLRLNARRGIVAVAFVAFPLFAEGRHPQDQRCAHGVRAPSSTEGEQQWHKAL